MLATYSRVMKEQKEVRNPIPRVIQCWFCCHEQHERCALPETCACYRCFPLEAR